ncbi:arginine methyl transferase [Rickenella mellea]|uniref:Arginine methyl transferase n=1 Tax=Rickenella mellea TaxID=50990 RepID=A0A4Y7Q9H1_9AGAM|nr:arginine methyl transferase [Rickenella mellea]
MSDHELDDDEIDALTEIGYNLIEKILERAPFDAVKELVDSGAPLWYQDEEDGTSCLHAVAFIEDQKLIEYLIEKGAVWNAVDNLGITAGDICLSLNNEPCYRIICDAGIRSEYMLSLLASRGLQPEAQSSLLLRSNDATAAGSSSEFFSSRLRFTTDTNGQEICFVSAGGQEIGVMMGWEREIMRETVKQLCEDNVKSEGLNVLNVGFGLGIIDSLFQSLARPPKNHCIIEAHPDVLLHMRTNGWYDRPGVTIFEGKWQNYMESEQLLGFGGFDVVYTDTFSESYQGTFFEHVPDLLSGPDARFSFFNGLGATNALFYDVYTQLAELNLQNLGLHVTWSDVEVNLTALKETWGESRVYFGLNLYRLPIAKMTV